MGRNYSDDEVEAIFRRALERQVEEEDGYGREELVAAAREVGLDDDAIDRAVAELDGERHEGALRERMHAAAREKWLRSFATYIIIAGGFLGAHAFGLVGQWVYWMAFGWGLAVALRAITAWRGPTEEAVEKEQLRQNRKARRKAQAEARAQARRDAKARKRAHKRGRRQARVDKAERHARRDRAAGHLEAVIEEGVTLLLAAAAQKLREAGERSAGRANSPRQPETDFQRYVAEQRGERRPTAPEPTPRPAPRARVAVEEQEPGEPEEVERARRRQRAERERG